MIKTNKEQVIKVSSTYQQGVGVLCQVEYTNWNPSAPEDVYEISFSDENSEDLFELEEFETSVYEALDECFEGGYHPVLANSQTFIDTLCQKWEERSLSDEYIVGRGTERLAKTIERFPSIMLETWKMIKPWGEDTVMLNSKRKKVNKILRIVIFTLIILSSFLLPILVTVRNVKFVQQLHEANVSRNYDQGFNQWVFRNGSMFLTHSTNAPTPKPHTQEEKIKQDCQTGHSFHIQLKDKGHKYELDREPPFRYTHGWAWGKPTCEEVLSAPIVYVEPWRTDRVYINPKGLYLYHVAEAVLALIFSAIVLITTPMFIRAMVLVSLGIYKELRGLFRPKDRSY